jgi:hypothetical protein
MVAFGQNLPFPTQLFSLNFGGTGGGGDNTTKACLSSFFQPTNSPSLTLYIEQTM